MSKKEAIIQQKIAVLNELGLEVERRAMSGMGREAFRSAIDDLLKQYRYLQKLQQDALRVSEARGRFADVAIY